MNRIILPILIVLSCIPCALAATATITLDSVIDTPDRTIVHDGWTYETTDIGIYQIDQSINVSVNVTGIKSSYISLIDKDKKPVWSQIIYYTEGHETLTVPASTAKTPGTYALTILYQGQILAVKQVVIPEYDLSISSRARVESGETLDVTVDINRDGIPVTVDETVKVVLSQGSISFEGVATRIDTGKYEASIKIPVIASGSFSLYCTVATNRIILGRPEIIGAASYGTVDVVPSKVAPPASTTTTTTQPSWNVYGLFAAVLLLVTAYLVKRKRHER